MRRAGRLRRLSDGGGRRSAAATASPITIGTSLPLTGEFSQPGTAAQQGYQVWQAMVNDNGGLLGREVELVIKDDASNQNTIVSDYNALISQDNVDLLLGTFSSLLNLPASAVAEKNQMLYVEPAGGSPDMFNRGYEYLFFAQQATADKQGKLFAEWVAEPAGGPAAQDRGLPDARRPVRRAERRRHPRDPRGGRHRDGLPGDLRDRHQELRHDRHRDEGGRPRRRRARRGLRGRRRPDPRDAQGRLHPEHVLRDHAPSFGEQYAEAIGAENTEGVMFAISHAPEADTPGNAEFVAEYKEMFGATCRRRTPPTRSPPPRSCRPRSRPSAASTTSRQLADWLRGNAVDTILGTCRGTTTGARTASS